MGFARGLLLKASRSQWLARQLRERRFFQRAVKRFMPGETLEAALDAAGQFAKAGLGTGLTELGEQVTNRSEERRVGEEGRSRWSPYHLKKKKDRRRVARRS